jgi:hypothetical protein
VGFTGTPAVQRCYLCGRKTAEVTTQYGRLDDACLHALGIRYRFQLGPNRFGSKNTCEQVIFVLANSEAFVKVAGL